jgi:hypothetical protein
MLREKASEIWAKITFSNASEPERLPLCFGYESETNRLPEDGVVAILKFIANGEARNIGDVQTLQ